MFSASADLYDLIHGSIKNYEDEAAKIAQLIFNKHPSAKTLLDVACGTGEHARFLAANHDLLVDGIDLDEGLIKIAAAKNPLGSFTYADMTDFWLGRRYDVVTCLFSAIGFAKTLERVTAALTAFAEHLQPDGLLLVEPWLPPGALEHGSVRLLTIEHEQQKICRMTRVEIVDNLSVLQYEYLVGTSDEIAHRSERHELGLFTIEQMTRCFEQAGLQVAYEPGGLFDDRGLFVATATGAMST